MNRDETLDETSDETFDETKMKLSWNLDET